MGGYGRFRQVTASTGRLAKSLTFGHGKLRQIGRKKKLNFIDLYQLLFPIIDICFIRCP